MTIDGPYDAFATLQPLILGTLARRTRVSTNARAFVESAKRLSAAPVVTGYIVAATHSFTDAFLAAAAILVAGIVAFVVVLRRIEPIPEPR